MKLNYNKTWETMNSLEQVTSKICSAREILECAIDALENHKKEKAEALMYAVDEYLQYYLQEFDSKFKDAWKETVVKAHQDESFNNNDVITFCDKDSSSETCKNSWVDFWDQNYPDEYYSKAYENFNQFGVIRGGESEDIITFGTPNEPSMPSWGHSDMEYLSQQKEDKVVKWRLPVEADGPSGEYFITFPNDLLERAGLRENDTLEWVDNKDGTFTLKKALKTYDDMVSSGYEMTSDGFWIKSDEC